MTFKRNPYFQPQFLICVAVLSISSAGMNTAMKWMDIKTRKEPIPLKKPFDQLEVNRLAPYKVVQRAKITNLDVLESLGTHDYIQWILEDPEVPASSPVRNCSLFITYYTGNPDRVPHVPNECYIGGGFVQKQAESLLLGFHDLPGPSALGIPAELSVQKLDFASKTSNPWDPQSVFSVLYFFKANGEYADSRTGVRAIMGKNFTCKYSYFSKVEWKFSGIGSPSKQDIEQASVKLMRVLLPLLETQHWPDWEKAKRDSASQKSPVPNQ